MLRWTGLVVLLAILYALAWQPLARDIMRTRDALERDRATLATVRPYAESRITDRAGDAAPSDPRAAVARALESRGLRAAASSLEAREGRVALVLGAVPFDALVAFLDDLSRNEGLRAIEARVTARVEPGTVRAELTLGR